MCGIAGLAWPGLAPDEAEVVVHRMLERLSHRGPESKACANLGETCLGHALLAFVTPPSAQPAFSPCGRVALVLAGQVYNYPDLARGLGMPAGTAESEALLQTYLSEGIGLFRNLRGMFALAIADGRSGTLLLARDPLGQKPLYYYRRGKAVGFASELGALHECPGALEELDPDAVACFLAFHSVPAPLTMYRGARKVRPGCVVTLTADSTEEKTYWSLPVVDARYNPVRVTDALGTLEELLIRAIRRCVEGTDEALGISLSGGVDSAVIASLASRVASRPLPAFTVGFEERGFDESRHAAWVASRLGLDHHLIVADGPRVSAIVEQSYPKLDEPVSDPSLIPMLLLCQEAKRSVKGLLSGDGADEFFLGYLTFQAARALRWAERLAPRSYLEAVRKAVDLLPAERGFLNPLAVARMTLRALGSRPELRFYSATAAVPLEQFRSVPWSSSWRQRVESVELTREIDAFVVGDLNHIERVQRGIICHFLRDLILTKVDRGSMLNSLEVRSPYLDLDLVEWTVGLPQNLKLRGRRGKYLLRRLAGKLLTRSVAARRKHGFRPPLAQLLRRELRDLMGDLLAARSVSRVGVFHGRTVVRMVDEHLRGARDHHRVLWSLMCFHLWARRRKRATPDRFPLAALKGT